MLLAIVAWVIAAQAGNKANHALKAANDATGVARRAEQTANNSHPEAASQAAPTTGAGPNTTVPTAGSGNTTPNGNGQ